MSEGVQSGLRAGLRAGHPDADELNAFMERALPEEARQQTLAHLAVCPDCRMIVMLAAGLVEEAPVSVEAVRGEARRWWRVPVWQWGFPVAVLGALVFAMVHRVGAPVVHAPEQRAAVPAPLVANAAPVLPPAETRAKVASGREVAKLPMEGRDAAPVEAERGMAGMPQVQAGMGVGAAAPQPVAPQPMPQAPAAVALGYAPTAAPAPAVAAAPKLPQAVAGESDVTAFAGMPGQAAMARASAPMMAAKAMLPPLPSGLAVVSKASGAGAMVALDGGNHLYVTRDGGAHWVAVAAQWSGRAVQVGLVGAVPVSSGPVDAVSNASATVTTGAAAGAEKVGSPVTGVVTDPSGAVVPGAMVTLSDAGTKAVVRTAVTDKDGRYAMAAAAGNYSLEAQKAGFTRDVVAIAVAAGKPVNANMSIAVGSESTVIEVTASNGDLQTLNAETAQMLPENKAKAPMKAMARAMPKEVFELVTENGEHWVSVDGISWRKK